MWNVDPARRDEGHDAGSSRPHRFTSTTSGPTRVVLIVEDKTSVLALLRRMLAPVGCTVLTAASLTDALALMRRMPPDVIVLDLRLPDATEEETLNAVFNRRMR